MDIFCSGLEVTAASYLQEVVIYGCTRCHWDALMLICCSCFTRVQSCMCTYAHTHTHTHTNMQSHTDAVREVVGVDSCWQFAVCGLTRSRCLPVWGSAVCCWTPSRNDFPVWREAPQRQTADCRRLLLHFIQRRIVRVNTSLSLFYYPIPIQIMDLNDFLSINGISE